MPHTQPERRRSVHVAVGVVVRGDSVLIARRPAAKHMGGFLELPGGKVEPGEPVRAALVRELAEEVAIEVDVATMAPLIQIEHDYGDKVVLLDVWRVLRFRGEPRGLEGQSVSWMRVEDLRDADFPAANRPIIRSLRLPREWLITGPCDDVSQLSRKLEIAVGDGHGCGLLLRQPRLAPDAYLKLAQAALPLCQAHGIPLMLHGPVSLMGELPEAAGVHLSQAAVSDLPELPAAVSEDDAGHVLPPAPGAPLGTGTVPDGKWLGVSCHSPAELVKAALAGADYATLSPVNVTTSHPLNAPLGWESFAQWVRSAALPVYALGGVGHDDINRSIRLGGQGIAGISHWWKAS